MKHKIFSIFAKIIKKFYLRLDIFNSMGQSNKKIIIIINLLLKKKLIFIKFNKKLTIFVQQKILNGDWGLGPILNPHIII